MTHRPKKTFLISSAILFVTVFAGCLDLSGPEACTAEWVPGLEVAVERADTGEPVGGALVVARDWTFADSARTELPPGDSGSAEARLAHERAGEYAVTVEKEGFDAWTRTDVQVDENSCHVETVSLTARLEPR